MDTAESASDERERRLLSHLQRAGELLRGEELPAAEQEVAEALALRPDDVRAQNLQGLLHFRAGRFPEAHLIFTRLVARDGEDPALRLNLGLVELRMGRHHDAVDNLRRVVEREPRNRRARGYLGLALLRTGDLVRARRAFLDAGQEDLARQVEERIAAAAEESERTLGEVRRIAEVGLKAVDEKEHPFSLIDADKEPKRAVGGEHAMSEAEAETAEGAWQVRAPGAPPPEPGREGPPPAPHLVEPLHLDPPVPVTEFATGRLVPQDAIGEPFGLTPGGMLVLRIEGRLPTRTVGSIMSTGQLTFEPLTRRVRGRVTGETFGEGVEALSLASGHGMILVSGQGARFTALSLHNDIVYLRETAIYAFEESLHWENGRVPGGGAGGAAVVQFRGTGRCVVRAARPLVCVKVLPDNATFVDHEALLGWIGRVVPRQLHGDDGELAPYLECTGEGVLILEEPPAA